MWSTTTVGMPASRARSNPLTPALFEMTTVISAWDTFLVLCVSSMRLWRLVPLPEMSTATFFFSSGAGTVIPAHDIGQHIVAPRSTGSKSEK